MTSTLLILPGARARSAGGFGAALVVEARRQEPQAEDPANV